LGVRSGRAKDRTSPREPVVSFLERLTAQPSVVYRRQASFYLTYDLPYLLAFLAAIALMWFGGWPGLMTRDQWSWWLLGLLPITFYLHVLANVCIHNACHVNFPKAINRIVGEILGVLVMTRFASWEILHTRHHKYSDDIEKDPHRPLPNFWVFLAYVMTVNLEKQLMNIMYDNHGDTPQNRRYEKARSVLSFSTMAVLFVAWLLFLGPWVFFFLFLPSQALGWLVVAHFNWITHDGKNKDGDYHPVNVDHGLYFIGNRVWFGLYMHGNHHKRANIFNPLRMDQVVARRRAAKMAEL
jgi:stearoyl-CoA desaturase (delta-9 desaturase)